MTDPDMRKAIYRFHNEGMGRRRSFKFPPYRSDKLTLSLAQRCIARSADSLALLEIL